jgi:hypothetical protein
MSASAFSLSIAVPAEGFRMIAGDPVPGGKRPPEQHYFCGCCLTWLFTRPEGLHWRVNVRASALDDHGGFVPFAELWAREKLPWAQTPARHSFETVPELAAFEPLVREFALHGVRPGAAI